MGLNLNSTTIKEIATIAEKFLVRKIVIFGSHVEEIIILKVILTLQFIPCRDSKMKEVL